MVFTIHAFIICSCIIISAKLGFLNWADSTGSREKPDNKTLKVVAFEEQAGIIGSSNWNNNSVY